VRRALALVTLASFLAVSLVVLQRPSSVGASAAERRPSNAADWTHVFRVIRTLKRKPPKVPVIYLLGGSAARECTISDRAWAAEVRYIGGHRVRTFNLGSSGQTYAQSTTVVKLLPAVPSVVLIGVNLGRYMPQPVILATRGGEPLTPGAPAAARRARGYEQHQYHVAAILTDAQKRAMVPWWLTHRYPIFKDNFAGNVAELDQLIATCQARGLHPVLVEMPLNQPIIGHAFDEPRKTYRDSCRALAKKYGIPKIDFLDKVPLVSGDFYDLYHLVEPGRVKWQLRLSKTVVSLLARYGMDKR
jgi:hypothetical protein